MTTSEQTVAAISAWLRDLANAKMLARQSSGHTWNALRAAAEAIERGDWKAHLPRPADMKAPDPSEAAAELAEGLEQHLALFDADFRAAEEAMAAAKGYYATVTRKWALLRAAYAVRTAPAAGEAEPKPKGGDAPVPADSERQSNGTAATNPRPLSAGGPSDLLAALEAAEKALGPFAKDADRYDPPEGDDGEGLWAWQQDEAPTTGDLRRAREARVLIKAAIAQQVERVVKSRLVHEKRN